MELPILVAKTAQKNLEAYCSEKSYRMSCPHGVLSYELAETLVMLYWQDGCDKPRERIARLNYSLALGQWSLFIPEQGNRWRPCLNVHPTLDLRRLLDYLDHDPLNQFWPQPFTCF